MPALTITPPFPTFAGKDGLPLEDGYIWIGGANLNPQTNPINLYWDETLTLPAVQPVRTLGGYPSYAGTPARLYISAAIYSVLVQDKNGSLVYSSPSNTGPSTFVNFSVNEEVQVATAGQTVFTLANTYSPGTNSLTVYVDGVNQYDGAGYSFIETSGNTVTFNTGLHVGALVKFSTAIQLSGGVADSSQISYLPAGAGAVTTNVQTKLRETVSVKDFGAVGDGVTDDTAAIQAAIDYASANNVTLNVSGEYAAYITLKSNLTLIGFKEAKFVRPSGYTGAMIIGSGGPFSNIIIDGVEFDSGAQTGTVYTLTADLTDVTFKNCKFKCFDNHIDANTAGFWRNVVFDNNTFEANQSVNYRTNLMALAKRTNGFYFTNNRCLYSGSIIHTLSSGSQIGVTSGNVFVENNYFFMFRGSPYQTRCNGAFSQANFFIRNNLIDGKIVDVARDVHGPFVIAHSLTGVTGASWDNVIIDGNTLRNIGYTDSDSEAIVAGGGAGTTEYLTNLVISNNYIDLTPPPDNIYTGPVKTIWLQKQGVRSAKIFGNTIINSSEYVVFSEPQEIDVEIYDNKIIGGLQTLVDAVNPHGAIHIFRNRFGITKIQGNIIQDIGNASLVTPVGVFMTGASGALPYQANHIAQIINNLIEDTRNTPLMVYGVLLSQAGFIEPPRNVQVTGNIVRGVTDKEIYYVVPPTVARTSRIVVRNNFLGFEPNVRVLGVAPTPSVSGEEIMMSNSSGGSLTNLTDGIRSQIVTIFNPNATSTTFVSVSGGGSFVTKSGSNIVLAQNQTVQFIYNQISQWCEV